eukprot:6208386-Pleurochrysis_carterae.AAC.2
MTSDQCAKQLMSSRVRVDLIRIQVQIARLHRRFAAVAVVCRRAWTAQEVQDKISAQKVRVDTLRTADVGCHSTLRRARCCGLHVVLSRPLHEEKGSLWCGASQCCDEV